MRTFRGVDDAPGCASISSKCVEASSVLVNSLALADTYSFKLYLTAFERVT